jgi:hypothetical protein
LTDTPNSSIINEVGHFAEISRHLDDAKVDEVLLLIAKTLKNPDVPASQIPKLITSLYGLAAHCAIEATYYKTYGATGTGDAGKEGRFKKDMYYTLADRIPGLADALKYTVRVAEVTKGVY